jgi:hypothetical protein
MYIEELEGVVAPSAEAAWGLAGIAVGVIVGLAFVS